MSIVREFNINNNDQYKVDQNTSLYNFKTLYNQLLSDLSHSVPYNILYNPTLRQIGNTYAPSGNLDTTKYIYPWTTTGVDISNFIDTDNTANNDYVIITLPNNSSISQVVGVSGTSSETKLDLDSTYTLALFADIVSGTNDVGTLNFGIEGNDASFIDDRKSIGDENFETTVLAEFSKGTISETSNVDNSKHLLRIRTKSSGDINNNLIKFVISNTTGGVVTFRFYYAAMYKGSIELGKVKSEHLFNSCIKFGNYDFTDGTTWDGNQWQFTNDGKNWDAIAGKSWCYREVLDLNNGFKVKAPVKAVYYGASALTLSGQPVTADGIQLVTGDRILYNRNVDTSAASANGIYVVGASSWTRSDDFNSSGNIYNGAYTYAISGTEYGGTSWVCTSPIDAGTWTSTDKINFQFYSTLGNITAGAGLLKNMSTGLFSVECSPGGGLEFDASGPGGRLMLRDYSTGSSDGTWYSSLKVNNLGIAVSGAVAAETSKQIQLANNTSNNATLNDIADAGPNNLWSSGKISTFVEDRVNTAFATASSAILFTQNVTSDINIGTTINLRDHVQNGPYSGTNKNTWTFINNPPGAILEIFRNGQRLNLTNDYTEITNSNICYQIEVTGSKWFKDDIITYKISDRGPQGQQGIQGLTGATGPQGPSTPSSTGTNSYRPGTVAGELVLRNSDGYVINENLCWRIEGNNNFANIYLDEETKNLINKWGSTDGTPSTSILYTSSHSSSGDLNVLKITRDRVYCGYDNVNPAWTGNPLEPTAFQGKFIGQLTSPSSVQFKDNIVPIENSINIINNLEGVSFNWKGSGLKDYGLIAEEVEKVLPELVDNSYGQPKLKYISLIGILLQSIKEQQKQIDKLAEEIELLKQG